MLVDSNDKKRLKLLLPDRDPICCDLPIIELQKSLFQRMFQDQVLCWAICVLPQKL